MVSLSNTQDWTIQQEPTHSRFRSGQVPSLTTQHQPNDVRQLDISQSATARVECYWAKQQDTQFHVSAASDMHMEQLRLPNVDRVEICQEFDAGFGDELAFDFAIAFLSMKPAQGLNKQVEVSLTHLDTGESSILLSRSLEASGRTNKRPSRQVEHIQHEISQTGHYQLRISQELRSSGNLAKFQLWVHDARVMRYNDPRALDLLSISSLGISKP